MAWTTPKTDFNAGDVLTAANMNAIGENLDALGPGGVGAWTSFTPTMSNTWALGNATVDAKYFQVGQLVSFYCRIEMGSTTTFGASPCRIDLPVTAASTSSLNIRGVIIDTGTGTYEASTVPSDGSTTYFLPYAITGASVNPYTACATTIPFTWAATDVMHFYGSFEAA